MNSLADNQENPSRPFVLWFTGFSGAGKSTLANAINTILTKNNKRTYSLDGDILRQGLCSDLAFSDSDRTENIRRVSEVTKIVLDTGCIVLAALISPKYSHRQQVRDTLKQNEFIEVYVDTAFDECERRDIKGLYKKARAGELMNFTGIDSSYEVPISPEIHIKTENQSIEYCVNQVMSYLQSNGYIEE